MKLMVQAVQAVTVELLGVLLVVWMLFGFASWGLHSAGGPRTTWHRNLADAALAWTNSGHSSAAATLVPHEQRLEFVAQRLDQYGQVLHAASRNVARQAWHGAFSQREVPLSADALSALPLPDSL